MLCGTDEQWAALARLHDGIGTIADRHMLAENFRENHLTPENMCTPAALWLDRCLEKILDGETPDKAFSVRKPGRSRSITPEYKAFMTLRFEQEKRAQVSIQCARDVILNEVHRTDWRNFERDVLLSGFGAKWTDTEIAKRIEFYRGFPRVFEKLNLSP